MNDCTWLDIRRGGHIHAIMSFDVSALALDAMPPAEETMVMMTRLRLRFRTDRQMVQFE